MKGFQMKRFALLAAALCCAAAFAQDKPTIAVYVTGAEARGTNKALATRMLSALVNSGRYKAVERSEEFLNQLDAEHVRQRSGAVNDAQIRKLGNQFGVEFICIADITPALGSNQVSARIVNVESAEVVAMGDTDNPLKTLQELNDASVQVVAMMFGAKTPTKPVQQAQETGPVSISAAMKDDKTGIEMVFVKGGTFTMGCTAEQGKNCDDGVRGDITVSDFHIGKYEITQKQWGAVMGGNPSALKGDNLPVERVSWDDAQEFIQKLNSMTGRKYRLPTEAEWEYAARGGAESRGYMYSGGNNIGDVAWYKDNGGYKTHPVGAKAPNELGVFDMSGNVWEWVSDRYAYETYKSSGETNPKGPDSGSNRVRRGGSWSGEASHCRVSHRYYAAPGDRSGYLGLRLVLSP